MSGDVQYVLVLNESGQRIATAFMESSEYARLNNYSFDLLPYKGQLSFCNSGRTTMG